MKTLLKDNWLKILFTIFIIIIVVISVGYLFYLFEKNNILRVEKEREYAQKRFNDCLAIYEVESKKFNNVESWYYSKFSDACSIKYKNSQTGELFSREF